MNRRSLLSRALGLLGVGAAAKAIGVETEAERALLDSWPEADEPTATNCIVEWRNRLVLYNDQPTPLSLPCYPREGENGLWAAPAPELMTAAGAEYHRDLRNAMLAAPNHRACVLYDGSWAAPEVGRDAP